MRLKRHIFFYKNDESELFTTGCPKRKVLVKTKWITVNYPAPEDGDAVYLTEFKGHCALRTPSGKSDVEFRRVLFPNELIKNRNQWKLANWTRVNFYLNNGKLHVSLLTRERAWMRCPTTPPICSPIVAPSNYLYDILLMEIASVLWKFVKTT